MSHFLRTAALSTFLFCLALITFRSGIDSYTRFDVDEPSWISVSSHTTDWVLTGDFRHQTWTAEEFHVFGNRNPPLAKYLIGASLKFFKNTGPVHFPWDWDKTREENIAEGHLPPLDILYIARIPSVILAALTAVLIFFITLRCFGNWIAALMAFLCLCFHPLFYQFAGSATLDMPAIAFTTAAIYWMIRTFELPLSGRKNEFVKNTLLCGVCLGLALSAKLNAAVAVLVFGTVLILQGATSIKKERFKDNINFRRLFFVGIIVAVSSLGIFYALNPLLWHEPVNGVRRLLSLSRYQFELAQAMPQHAIDSWMDRFESVFNFVIFNSGLTSRLTAIPLDRAFIILGLFAGFFRLFQPKHKGLSSSQQTALGIVLAWFLIAFGAVVFWSPLSWPRYYIPIVPAAMVLEGLGLFVFFKWLLKNYSIPFPAKTKISKVRIAISASLLITTIALITAYTLYGHLLIEKMYFGQAPEFLNHIIEGQAYWPLKDYIKKADNLAFAFSFFLPLLVFVYLFSPFRGLVSRWSSIEQEIRLKYKADGNLAIFVLTLTSFCRQYFVAPFASVIKELWKEAKSFFQPLARLELAACAILSLIPVLLAGYFIMIHRAPFWFYCDPDLWYFANGIDLLLNGTIGHSDHPGTPCQMLVAALLFPVFLFSKITGAPFAEFCVTNVQPLTAYLRVAFAALTSAGVFVFSMAIKRLVKIPGAALLSVLLLLSIFNLVFYSVRINPETLMILLFALWLGAYGSFESEADEEKKQRYFYLAATLAGLTLANKFTAFPLIVFTLFFLRPCPQALFFCALGFLVGVFPLLFQPAKILSSIGWIGQIAIHQGHYGEGNFGLPAFTQFVEGAQTLWADEKLFLTTALAFSVIFFVYSAIKRDHLPFKSARVSFFIFSGVLWLPVVMKHPGSRYSIVALFLVTTALLLAITRFSLKKGKLIVSILIFAVTFSSALNVRKNFILFDEKMFRLQALDAFVRPIATDVSQPVIAFGYMEPMWPSWALLFASGRADGVLTEAVARRFPHHIEYVVWKGLIRTADGRYHPVKDARWDYLFISRFPDYFSKFEAAMEHRGFEIVSYDKTTDLYLIKRQK